MVSHPFDEEHALHVYNECMRRIQIGAYEERQEDGTYGEDGVELAIANLEHRAWQQGFFFAHKGNVWTLEPMSEQQQDEYRQAQHDGAFDEAKSCVVLEMPYVTVGEARLFQYHAHSDRWYVEVDVKHHDKEQGTAMVLCRVAYDPAMGWLRAQRITVVETNE